MSNPSGRLEVIISPPGDTNLVSVADSTTAVFEVLLPLCEESIEFVIWLETRQKAYSCHVVRSPVVKELVAHVKSYVKAVDFSIVAAHEGFNIAEEAVNFSKVVHDHTTDS
jgi:hypothetical protein